MSWTVALATGALVVSIAVLYHSLVSLRRPNPELERLRREHERLASRLEQAEQRLGTDGETQSPTSEEDRA